MSMQLTQAIHDALTVLTDEKPIAFAVKLIRRRPKPSITLEPIFVPSILGLYEKTYPALPRDKQDLEISLYHPGGAWVCNVYLEEEYPSIFSTYKSLVREVTSLVNALEEHVNAEQK